MVRRVQPGGVSCGRATRIWSVNSKARDRKSRIRSVLKNCTEKPFCRNQGNRQRDRTMEFRSPLKAAAILRSQGLPFLAIRALTRHALRHQLPNPSSVPADDSKRPSSRRPSRKGPEPRRAAATKGKRSARSRVKGDRQRLPLKVRIFTGLDPRRPDEFWKQSRR